MNECLIALGGNVQISGQVFEDSLAQLTRRGCSCVKMSRILSTRPVGSDAGFEFLNAAAVLQTELPALELLHRLHEVEATFGRVRTLHWGPRTLDLDLILYGDQISNTAQFVLPHPAMWYRRFVLEPAVEIAPEMVHPILNESISQLYDRLLCRPLLLEICGTKSLLHDRIQEAVIHSGDEIVLKLKDPANAIAPESFARIDVCLGKLNQNSQPFNRNGREIQIIGETAEELSSMIEQLKTAMLG